MGGFAWLVLAMALCPGPAASEEPAVPAGSWLVGAPVPTQRSEVGVGVAEGKIYVVGGFEAPSSTNVMNLAVSRTVEEYDPILNGWTTKASLPMGLHHPGVAAHGRFLYVVGGFMRSGIALWTPVATLYRYDPVTDLWAELHPMPTARGALGVGVADNKIFAIGGYDGTASTAAVEIYDPASDRWTTGASLTVPRDHLAVAALGSDLYAIGGRVNKDYARNLALVEQFHLGRNQWIKKMDLPAPRSGLAAASVGRRLYVFGGEAPDGTVRTAEEYLPELDRWRAVAAMPTGRHGLGAAVVGDRVYVLAGGPRPGTSLSSQNDIFVPQLGEPGSGPGPKASATQVGSVMAILAAWSEAGVLPPETTPDASRIVKSLIQFQSAMMKSANPHVVKFFDAAIHHKFGQAAEQMVRQGRRDGWTSRTLEAFVEYGTGPAQWDRAGLESGWREFNVVDQDLRLLASLHFAARQQFAMEGKDIHAVYEEKRRLMPGAR